MTTQAPAVEEQESAYRAQTIALAAVAAVEMTAALTLPVPDPVFLAAGAAVVARAASRAVAAADLSLAVALAVAGSLPVPLGLLPDPRVPARAREGLTTLLATLPGEPPEDGAAAAERRKPITPRAVRLARNESLNAGADAYTEGMTRRRVPGWTRVTGPDPCPLCAGLAARDEVLPASHRMARHTGCSCVQRPTSRPPTRGRAR